MQREKGLFISPNYAHPETAKIEEGAKKRTIPLSWMPVSGASEYRIYRRKDDGPLQLLTVLPHDEKTKRYSFMDDGSITPDAEGEAPVSEPVKPRFLELGPFGYMKKGVYYYRVSAVNDTGETAAGEPAGTEITEEPAQVVLTWSSVTGAKKYRVYRSKNADSWSGSLIAEVDRRKTTWIDHGMPMLDWYESPVDPRQK